MSHQLFITGATGNIGSRVVVEMLKARPEDRLILLVRGASDEEARIRALSAIAESAGRNHASELSRRVQVVAGDVRCAQFGLSPDTYRALAKATTHIIHVAGATSFVQTYREAHATNCIGAANVIEFAGRCSELGHLNNLAYVSTAYVNRSRSGLIREDYLDHAPPAKNSYDISKWEAEQIFGSHSTRLPITVFRPSIVVGDSQTGYTGSFNVLYVPLHAIALGQVEYLPGTGETPLDIVPLDYVARAMAVILRDQSHVGKTYHLVAGRHRAVSCIQLVERLRERLARIGTPVRAVRFSPGMASSPSRWERLLHVFGPYMSEHWEFDDANTRKALRGTGLHCPHPADYFDTVLRYCEERNWGRRLRRAA